MIPKLTRTSSACLLPRFSLAILVGACIAATTTADETADALFENSIRPVLVETCFRCHGDAKVSGELRVDSREALLKGGESGAAIVPGKPQDSLLLKAIQRQADVSAMPPEKEKALRGDQVAAFQAWVHAGAHWPQQSKKFESARHWASEPVRDIGPPTIRDTAWATNGIDWFIRAKQEAVGVHPAPPADKLTLIRRATLDLTGLPPTPGEVEAFQNDASPQAFENLVDRLLESPHYGQRWGRHWLDVVRYADTAGETADYPVPLAWRYRNYVIDAFNADKPYDKFLREQIAGDVLANQGPPDRYAEQVTATGYLAISRRFGFDSENYHHLTIQDTIDTLGQSVLGLSLGCARCHDHKFDAVSMHDYYALYGIFDSSRYAFPGSEQKQKFRSMAPLLPPRESLPKWRAFDQHVGAIADGLEKRNQAVPAAILRSLNDLDGDFEMQAPAAGGSNGVLVPPWLYEGKIAITNAAQSPFKNLYARGKVGASIAAGAGKYRIAQSLYPRRSSSNCSALHVNLDFRVAAPEGKATGSHRFRIGSRPDSPAVVVLIASEAVSLQIGEATQRLGAVKPNEWHNLQLRINLADRSVSGSVGMPGSIESFADKSLSPNWSDAIDFVVLDASDRSAAELPAIEIDNLGVQEEPIPPVSTELPNGLASASESPPAAIENDAQKAAQEFNALVSDGPFAMTYGMAEGTPHNVRMQMRGEPEQLGEEVPRGLIRILGGGPLPEETLGSGRLELAQWLTQATNPLTARVMVNRIWQYHFGRGLVKTPNDFGVRGLPPTHPELLDHLATEFVRSGWSVKAMHRLIMRSATYRLSSVPDNSQPSVTAGVDASDLYTRFARRRLSAEEIRDCILAVSGELDRAPGHEHPFPSPVDWKFTQHGPFSAVYEHNKRSVYLMTQRLKRHPFLALFDGPDPNATTADRLGTTVPTQALFFLNDPFVHAKAEAWSSRLRAGFPAEDQQIEQAYRAALARPATNEERYEASTFLAASRAELAAIGQDNVDGRALAAFLRTIFGSNEFLHVD